MVSIDTIQKSNDLQWLSEDYQNKIEKLEKDNVKYKEQYYLIKNEKQQKEIEINKKPYVSEKQALQYIRDYYSFYNKDFKYRNVQLRRKAKNSFTVSLEECINKADFTSGDFFWNSTVRTLTVYEDGNYDF